MTKTTARSYGGSTRPTRIAPRGAGVGAPAAGDGQPGRGAGDADGDHQRKEKADQQRHDGLVAECCAQLRVGAHPALDFMRRGFLQLLREAVAWKGVAFTDSLVHALGFARLLVGG